MTSKELIIMLLIQDMRYHQLVTGITHLGFGNECHGSDVLLCIAALMDIKDGAVSDDWLEGYMDFLRQAAACSFSTDPLSLQPLAERCYGFLEREKARW
jgi:hypothetical protein